MELDLKRTVLKPSSGRIIDPPIHNSFVASAHFVKMSACMCCERMLVFYLFLRKHWVGVCGRKVVDDYELFQLFIVLTVICALTRHISTFFLCR